MSINSKNTSTPLFHCVDLDWRGQGFTFMFSPKFQEEAECMILSLPTFLKHHYPEVNITQHFSNDAIARNEGLAYNEELQMVVDTSSPTQVEEEEDHDHLKGFEVDVIIDMTSNDQITRPSEIPTNDGMPKDDDSISTLRIAPSMLNSSAFTPVCPRRSPRTTTSASTSSNTSTITMESITSLQSQLESLSSRLAKQESDVQSKFDTIIKLMPNKPNSGGANHSHDGQSNTGGGNSAGDQL